MFVLHSKGYIKDTTKCPSSLLYHCDCHLCMEVFRSSAFILAICPDCSIRRRYILLISSAKISIDFLFANTNVTSPYTVLKTLIRLIALRRYTEDSILLLVPTENVSDHIGQAYSIVDVTTAEIILLLNGPGTLIFGIIPVNASCVSDAFTPINFICFLNFYFILTPSSIRFLYSVHIVVCAFAYLCIPFSLKLLLLVYLVKARSICLWNCWYNFYLMLNDATPFPFL